jgi:hypothetical protein
MAEQTIQDKIQTIFNEALSDSSKFSEDEVEGIMTAISSSLKSDRIFELVLKSIGGIFDENT